MKLFDMTESGNCYKVRLLLSQLGCAWERIAVPLISEAPRPAALRRANPSGRVPLLILDEERSIAESNAILYYLADGTDMLPKQRFQRAQVLRWMFFEQNHIEPNIAVVRHWRMTGRMGGPYADAIRIRTKAGHDALAALDNHLSRREFLVERYSIADIAVFGYTHVAEEGSFDLAPYAAIRDWIERVRGTPGFVAMHGEGGS